MPDVNTFKRKTGTNSLRQRIIAVKELLPRHWIRDFFVRFPQYDNIKGHNLVKNVIYGKSTDEGVTECFEELVGITQK